MTPYRLPDYAFRQLETMVDRIQANQGKLIEPGEFDTELDTSRLLSSLPPGMSDDDFVGILKLALLTECATDTYAREISNRARDSSATWLERFTEQVWKPDEYTHAQPFKLVLLGLGFSEAELDESMRETQEQPFEHTGGDSPVHVTTFGMVQEYLTDHWYSLIGRLLRPGLPEAAHMTNRVKQRETLHTVWYRDMTALQLEAQPELIASMSEELCLFRLPGNSLIPDLQSQASRWLPLMGADYSRMAKEMMRLFYSTVESPKLLGRVMFDVADAKDVQFKGVRPRHVRFAMGRLGGWGYGLVGEAIMERTGLGFLFRRPEDAPDQPQSLPAQLRARMRTWLAGQMAFGNEAPNGLMALGS